MEAGEGSTEQSLVILSLKNLRKEAARVGVGMVLGSVGGGFRERRLSNADQSLRGCSLEAEMNVLKYSRREAVIIFETTFDCAL